MLCVIKCTIVQLGVLVFKTVVVAFAAIAYLKTYKICHFFSLGATSEVAPQLSAEQLSQGSYSASDIVRLPTKEATTIEGATASTATAAATAAAEVVVLHATRARMLLLNFVFIRYV